MQTHNKERLGATEIPLIIPTSKLFKFPTDFPKVYVIDLKKSGGKDILEQRVKQEASIFL